MSLLSKYRLAPEREIALFEVGSFAPTVGRLPKLRHLELRRLGCVSISFNPYRDILPVQFIAIRGELMSLSILANGC
jgi:hypothetical protein